MSYLDAQRVAAQEVIVYALACIQKKLALGFLNRIKPVQIWR